MTVCTSLCRYFRMRILVEFGTMSSIGHPCSDIQGPVQYLSLMRPGRFCITSLDQANNPCLANNPYSTFQTSVGRLSLMIPGCSSITSLDQQSLSQFSIGHGNKPL